MYIVPKTFNNAIDRLSLHRDVQLVQDVRLTRHLLQQRHAMKSKQGLWFFSDFIELIIHGLQFFPVSASSEYLWIKNEVRPFLTALVKANCWFMNITLHLFTAYTHILTTHSSLESNTAPQN